MFPADRATPLVMVLTELVQNAVEHAFDPGVNGTVTVNAQRSARMLDVVVRDEGKGLPEGFSLERRTGSVCRSSGPSWLPSSADRWS